MKHSKNCKAMETGFDASCDCVACEITKSKDVEMCQTLEKSDLPQNENIPKGKLKIICPDGLTKNCEVITPSGDKIFAKHIRIEVEPDGFCTAIITVNRVPVELDILNNKILIDKKHDYSNNETLELQIEQGICRTLSHNGEDWNPRIGHKHGILLPKKASTFATVKMLCVGIIKGKVDILTWKINKLDYIKIRFFTNAKKCDQDCPRWMDIIAEGANYPIEMSLEKLMEKMKT